VRNEAPGIAGTLDDSLLSHFDNLYRRHRLAGKTAGTIRKYRAAINHFGKSLGHAPRLADLSDLAVLDTMDHAMRRGRSPATCNSIRAKLVSLWGFLARKGLVSIWPDVALFDEPERTPRAWMPDELRRLWVACLECPGMICGREASSWWIGLHSLLYDTGERIGAVMQLTWADVDVSGRWVNFRAETRKGKRKANLKRLHADTVLILSSHVGQPGDKVFPWSLTMERLWQTYEGLLKSAGLPCDRRNKFHKMRRTHASFFEAAGGNATESLGHSSRAITERYLDLRIVGKQQPCDVLPRPDQKLA
jgi:integrase